MSFHLPGKHLAAENLDDHDPDQFRPPAYSGSGQGYRRKLGLEPNSPTKGRANSIDAHGPTEPQTNKLPAGTSTSAKNRHQTSLDSWSIAAPANPADDGRRKTSGLTSVIAPYFQLGNPNPIGGGDHQRPLFLRQQSQSHPDLSNLDIGDNSALDHFGEDVFKSRKIMFYAPSKSYCGVADTITADYDLIGSSTDNLSVNKVRRSSTAIGALNSNSSKDLQLKGFDNNWLTKESDDRQLSTESAPNTARNESPTARNESQHDPKRANFGITSAEEPTKKYGGGLFQMLKNSEFFTRPVKVTHYDVNTFSPSSG